MLGATNSANVWENLNNQDVPIEYGKTGNEIRKRLKLEFTNSNVKLLIDVEDLITTSTTDFNICA
jgi:hypothetical protein